jgi:hypothetical protein
VLEAVEVGLAAVGNVAFQPGEVDPFPLLGVVAAEPEADRTDPDAWADPGDADAGFLGEFSLAGVGSAERWAEFSLM